MSREDILYIDIKALVTVLWVSSKYNILFQDYKKNFYFAFAAIWHQFINKREKIIHPKKGN